MTQFDAFPNPVHSLRRAYPFVVDLRSDLFPEGNRLIIAPLVPRVKLPGIAGRLAPVVRIDADEYVVLIDRLVSIPAGDAPTRIANLVAHREALIGALDLLFSGF
jgi:toxin CcdB